VPLWAGSNLQCFSSLQAINAGTCVPTEGLTSLHLIYSGRRPLLRSRVRIDERIRVNIS
jgi:hypothetical protein